VSNFSALVGCMVYIIPNESFTLQIQYICMYMQLFLIHNIDMNSDRIVIGNRLQNSCSEYIRTHFSDINGLMDTSRPFRRLQTKRKRRERRRFRAYLNWGRNVTGHTANRLFYDKKSTICTYISQREMAGYCVYELSSDTTSYDYCLFYPPMEYTRHVDE